jgi:hypothetical protein
LYNEKLSIAKAMTPCQGKLHKKSLLLAYPKNIENPHLKTLIKQNFDDFFEYISHLAIDIDHKEKTQNFQNSSQTRLVLRTTCFKVDFNDSFVTITAIEKR